MPLLALSASLSLEPPDIQKLVSATARHPTSARTIQNSFSIAGGHAIKTNPTSATMSPATIGHHLRRFALLLVDSVTGSV